MTLAVRHLQPELMDAPDVEATAHRQALAGLARINRISLSSRILWPSIQALARRSSRPLRVLDLASGGGDVLCDLGRRSAALGLKVELFGLDRSPVAVETARGLALRRQIPVRFVVGDVLHGDWPDGMDVVMCSLFLHHLETAEVIQLLNRMSHAATTVLANDLIRSRLGYQLAWWGCRLLTRSPIVHVDGPRSVEGAFTLTEIRDLAQQAGLETVQLSRHWPERFLLWWDRS